MTRKILLKVQKRKENLKKNNTNKKMKHYFTKIDDDALIYVLKKYIFKVKSKPRPSINKKTYYNYILTYGK